MSNSSLIEIFSENVNFDIFANFEIGLLGERSEAYSHKNTSKWFRFLPSVTSLSFHLFKSIFSQHLLVGFIRFLYKHYDVFKIYHVPSFRSPNFFSACFLFSDFLEGKGYILSPVFIVNLEMQMFLH